MSGPGPGAALPPLAGARRVVGTLALSLAVFMNVLDTSIANVSIPAISGDLGVSPGQGTWVITSFAVANAIAVPLTGWLTQRIGPVRLFVASVLLFTLASWLCGIAPSIEALIGCRVLQGFVAGPMIPLSQTLLLSSYPRERAGTALATWAMTTLVAPVMGPLLGGWITDHLSWPWIFYINVPVGLAAAAATWSIYRRRESPTRRLPIDAVGLLLLVVWVGALQIMLDKGKELDWFGSGLIVGLALVAAVGFAAFLAWELTERHPVVDLSLFARRNFAVGCLALSVAYALFFGNVVLLPLWLQQWMGYTATAAGLAVAPVGLLAIVLSPIVGRSMHRVDPRVFSTIAFLVFALVLWLRSRYFVGSDFGQVVLPTVVQGVASACFFIPLTTLIMSGLPPERIAAASGLSNFARITAGAVGTSIATTLWDDRAAMHHAHLVESITRDADATQRAIGGLTGAGMTEPQALAHIDRLIDQQAFTLAADEIFLASAAVFVALIAIVWLARPIRGAGGGPVAVAD